MADEGEDAPIIRLVQKTLDEALEQRASDVHIEFNSAGATVRYRICGILEPVLTLPAGALSIDAVLPLPAAGPSINSRPTDVLVTLGNPSTQALLQTREGIMRTRGKWLDYDTGTRTIRD